MSNSSWQVCRSRQHKATRHKQKGPVQTSVMYNRKWRKQPAQWSLAQLLQTNSSGIGFASGMPWQRVCIHTPHTSHATIRSPSSTRVPHLQLTTQSSKPPAMQQNHLHQLLQLVIGFILQWKIGLYRPAFVCQNRRIMHQSYLMQKAHYAENYACQKFCSNHVLLARTYPPRRL